MNEKMRNLKGGSRGRVYFLFSDESLKKLAGISSLRLVSTHKEELLVRKEIACC